MPRWPANSVKSESPKGITGAPAALQRVAEEELDASRACDRLRKAIDAEKSNEPVNAIDKKDWQNRLDKHRRDYSDELERWYKAVKTLKDMDKSVAPERRTGAMIPQAEVEVILEQVFRFDRIAQETQILSISQDAIRCKDEQEYYERFAEAHRTCRLNAILQGVEHEKFPEWVRDAFESSL